MKQLSKTICNLALAGILITPVSAQKFTWIKSIANKTWQQTSVKLLSKDNGFRNTDITVKGDEKGITFKAWGTCFNELGWDALNMISSQEQEKIMSNLFSPTGDLRFSIGRIPMNANDYARSWYSCDSVDGDFGLKFFNIDRDMQTLVPYIHKAQKYNPYMTFWISPWSPPVWMKTNHHYAQQGTVTNGLRKEVESPAYKTDQFIMEPRYLNAYANYFCKFIDAYKTQNIPIDIVMYQNEAYSFTPYPGCAWTTKASILFNKDYLGPTLAHLHPEVELYLGTINTNNENIIDSILGNKDIQKYVKGAAFQWEGGQIVGKLHQKYPNYKYMMSESECGWGDFSWKAAEHTFSLMCHYLSNGCETYTFWNAIIADNGSSTWGWKQNGLIHIDSKQKSYTYTPEYYAAKHFCHYVTKGTKLIGAQNVDGKKPVMIFIMPDKKKLVIAGNLSNDVQQLNIKIESKHLSVSLPAHSFNTFCEE
jgi:glucosylceramidase